MLVSYEYLNEGLLLSYIDKTGNLKYKTPTQLSWPRPTNWITTIPSDPDKDPTYRTWDDKPVKEVWTRRPNKYSIFEKINEMSQDVLDDVFSFSNRPPIYFVDIETKKGKDGYSDPDVASEPVTLITICKGDKLLIMGTQSLDLKEQQYVTTQINNYMRQFDLKMNIKFKWYDNERAMLHGFFVSAKNMPIITGWNFDGYDWPYLTNRYKRFGGDVATCSPVGRTQQKLIRTKSKTMEVEKPLHKLIMDYMELYQKWANPKLSRESSKLDFVADKTLGARKIEYDQDLEHLMNTDYKKYVYYGGIDTILVQLIHEKMQYFNIMASISVRSRIRMEDSLSTVAVTEGYLRKPLKDQEHIVFVKNYDDNDNELSLPGGWVMHPIRGLVGTNACYDFNSLYPTTQQIFNLAGESYRGIIIESNGVKQVLRDDGKIIPLNDTDIVTANINDGDQQVMQAVFSNDTDSTTKKQLASIYADRKKHKAIMLEADIELKSVNDRIKILQKMVA